MTLHDALFKALELARAMGTSELVSQHRNLRDWTLGGGAGAHYRVHPSGKVFLCQDDFEMSVARLLVVRVDGERERRIDWIAVPDQAREIFRGRMVGCA